MSAARQRVAVALGISLLLHLAFLLFAGKQARPIPAEWVDPSIDVEIEGPQPAAALRVASPKQASTPALLVRQQVRRGSEKAEPSTRSSPGPVQEPASRPIEEARRVDLTLPLAGRPTEDDGVPGQGDGLSDRDASVRGVLGERESEARIQGWLTEGRAVARAQDGPMDENLSRLAVVLRESLREAAKGKERELESGFFAGWEVAAQHYGATGNPTDADGSIRGRSAVVEISQGADGSLTASFLVQRSGDPLFDGFVLAAVPLAFQHLSLHSRDGGVPSQTTSTRSRWAFDEQLSTPADLISFLVPLVERALGPSDLDLRVHLVAAY